MKKILRNCFFLILILISFHSMITGQEILNNLLFYRYFGNGNGAIILFNFKNNQESQLIESQPDGFDVLSNKIIYCDYDKKQQLVSIKVFDLKAKIISIVLSSKEISRYWNPTWEDNSNISITMAYKSNRRTRYLINIKTKKVTDISFKDNNGNLVFKQTNNNNSGLYIAQPINGSDYPFRIYDRNNLVYEGADESSNPSFVNSNKNEIAFSKTGNLYIYNYKSKTFIKITDFPEEKWDPIYYTGYNNFSLSKQNYLAVDYSKPGAGKGDSAEIRIFSSEMKLIKNIPNGNSPKWIE